ncbi:MAG: hypothetical protein IAG10_19485 [Planctomycetaceae bacterium]|nr:hypothetical protein [Planctomycetaceae bacterium]
MKLVTGAILFLAAEQAYAHAHLVQFPNHDVASRVLVPGSLVLLVLAVLMFVWGLLTEARSPNQICREHAPATALQSPKS